MEIHFRGKEESNKLQQEAFLRLSPAERFYAFLDLSERISKFPQQRPDPDRWKGNFVIEIKVDGENLEGKH